MIYVLGGTKQGLVDNGNGSPAWGSRCTTTKVELAAIFIGRTNE
jgi:hypothetical protein